VPSVSATALQKGLCDRQLRIIAIGGVIGAGLFVGSGVVIGSTGPGSFITYALCGGHHGHADARRDGGGQPVDRDLAARASESLQRVVERSAEELVVQQWAHRTTDAAVAQLEEARARSGHAGVDVVIGTDTEWREAVDDIAWEPGDVLLLGSAAAGPLAQVFLGAAASKILRHAPVPAMIAPRR
jgi:nucleotide-binding universal stress UspA family protein